MKKLSLRRCCCWQRHCLLFTNQNITVSGRVLEDTNEPAVQATIQLLSLPDSAYAAGVATTGNGYFTLPKVNAGKYVLKVSYIGFKNKFLPLHLYANVRNKMWVR